MADTNVETLLDFQSRYHWHARNGQPGAGKNMTGKNGESLTLTLPVGTIIYDEDTGVLLKDLSVPGEAICIAEGGSGGRGNARFKRADHQTPREFEKGTPGQERTLRLELKL
ncbi:MAG: GTPase ObgE, partial [Rhodobacteraceae bacterium]|nr:GTPase ObgE [Paracoccaceae bacterium]